MEQQWSPWQPALTTVLAVAVMLLLIAVGRKSRKPRLPGPRGWPVLGCIPLLGTLPHQTLARFAKKYGPLMFLKLGSKDVIIISSPKLAEECLKTFNSRFINTAAKITMYDGQDIVFAEYGPRWRYARKVMVELLTPKRLSEFQKPRTQELLTSINDAIERCCGGLKSVRMDLILRKTALNTVIRMMTNDAGLSDKSKAVQYSDEILKMTSELFYLIGAFYLGDYIPWLDRLDPQGLKKRMHAVARTYDGFLQGILDEHKMKLEEAKSRPELENTFDDLVYTLLTRPRDADGQYLSETEMKGIMLDMIVAGSETSSTTVEWGLSELLRNPHIMEKAKAEIYSVVGRERLVEESDLPNLPYLDAIVKEILRLHPPSILLGRTNIEDCEIQGYKFPARTQILVNVYAIQRDPKVWDRPLDFYPERFVGSKKDLHGFDSDFLPFGTGRKVCAGKSLGLLAVQYAMALYIQTCNFSLPGQLKPEELDMEESYAITVARKNHLEAVVVPALPRHIFHDFQK